MSDPECVYGKRPDVCACTIKCQYLHGDDARPDDSCRRIAAGERLNRSPWTPTPPPPSSADEYVQQDKLGTNPKDLLGAKKIDLSIVPAVGIWHEAAALFDGGIEYDTFNWRENKVLARVYIAAMRRHIDEWESGIEETRDTGVHHLGAVRACAGILLDAQMTGNLIDNRPKSSAFAAVVEKLNAWAKARVAKGRYRNV